MRVATTLAVLLLSGTAIAGPSPSVAKMHAEMLLPTVQVGEVCSGTVIHSKQASSGAVETFVLTAKHCIAALPNDGSTAVSLPYYQGNREVGTAVYSAKVFAIDESSDLALLGLDDTATIFPSVARIAPSESELYMAESVWTAGFPMADGLLITQGLLGGYVINDFPNVGTEYLRATTDLTVGGSGGGLYHISEAGAYEVIGVAAARVLDNTFMGVFTPVDAINAFLKTAAPQIGAADVVGTDDVVGAADAAIN